jgi:bifunctional UDP-N-acetylglucosamine pyrophosphorylase / glucosamine-1-phosphate N-acetyltransferase
MKVTAIILAAGHGTRMRSKLPKMLHPLAGKPLVMHALGNASLVSDDLPVVVVGYGEDAVRQAVGQAARFVVQEQQLGTGHAVMAAEDLFLSGQSDLVLVTYADMPLLKPDTLRRVIDAQRTNPGPISMLSVELPDPHGFGRVVRRPDGTVKAVVEEAQASPEILAIRELNASVFCFRSDWLWPALKRIRLSPKGEFYLTDTVELAVADGLEVRAISTDDPTEAVGINNRVHLAEAEAILRQRINTQWMLAGVTLVDPLATYIEPGVTIGQDTVIWPNTYLRGQTVIGEDCEIGPNTIIEDSQVGNACTILAALIEKSVLEDGVNMGPFAHLRPGVRLGKGVHMGNFGEIKNSTLAAGVKMGHFSYIGDATIGEGVNIGAGTITCNFDGVKKHKTVIGPNAFIGSDTMLVAPLTIGAGAKTGAGSVVTHDVPDHGTVVGVPARPFPKRERDE